MFSKSVNIIISESQFNNCLKSLMTETLVSRGLLTEGDSRISKIRNSIMPQYFGRLLNLNDIVPSSEYYVHDNPNTTWSDYLLYNLRHTFGLMRNSDVPILLYIAPIAWSDEVGFDKRNDNNDEVDNLTKICKLLQQNPDLFVKAERTCDTYQKLSSLCGPVLQKMREESKNKMNNTNYTPNKEYTILRGVNFKQAREIGNYSALQDNKSCLCYTQYRNIWEQWTKEGRYTAFVCLKNGWKEMQPKAGPNAPYDEYGLSMIFVFVNVKGELVASNTRWNHENANGNSVDHAFTEEQLSSILGIRFEDAFKPMNEEEVRKIELAKYKSLTENFMRQVEHYGEPYIDRRMINLMSSEAMLIGYEEYYNIYNTKTKTLSSPQKWYSSGEVIDEPSKDATVCYAYMKDPDDQFDLYNEKGQLVKGGLSFKLYDSEFCCGYVAVNLGNGHYNAMDMNGNLLFPDVSFDEPVRFNKFTRLAKVVSENLCNLATTDGKLLFNDWMDDIRTMGMRTIVGTTDGNKYLFDPKGNLICTADSFKDLTYNYLIVEKGGKYNVINLDTPQLLSPDLWYDSITMLDDIMAEITVNGQTREVNLFRYFR